MDLNNTWKRISILITCKPMKVYVVMNSLLNLPILILMNSKLCFLQQEEYRLRNSLKKFLTSVSQELSMLNLHLIQTLRNSGANSKMQMEKQVNPSFLYTLRLFICRDTSESSSKYFRITQRPLTFIILVTRKRPLNYSIPKNFLKYSHM